MPRLGRLGPFIGMASAAALLYGCQFIGGFAGNEIVDPGQGGQGGSAAGGGGPGGSSGGEGGGTNECALSQAPEGPPEARAGDDVTFVLAARSIELGEDLDQTLGLDIDDACTCSDDDACPCASVATCTRPTLVKTDAEWQRCDGPGGIDANSAQLFNIITTFAPLLSSQFLSSGMAAGGGTMLLEVREYNGLADDDKVFVGVYATGAFQTAECNDDQPQWDGEDAWPISNDSVFRELPACDAGMAFPSVFDSSAYVVDHNLVARLDEVTVAIQFGDEALKLTLTDVVVLAPLQQTGGRWLTTRATIAGRWALDDVFRGLGELDKVATVDLCDPAMLGSTQSNVCAFVDTTTSPGSGDACNAVSFALEFDAEEAKLGNTIDLPSSNACPELLDLDCETPVQ